MPEMSGRVIIFVILFSCISKADAVVSVAAMERGRNTYDGQSLDQPLAGRVSRSLQARYQKDCPRSKLQQLFFKKKGTPQEIYDQILNRTFWDFDRNQQGYTCFPDTEPSTRPRQYPSFRESFSLLHTDTLLDYYTQVRLPMEAAGVQPPEHRLYNSMFAEFPDKCRTLNHQVKLGVETYGDPVALLPLIIELGQTLQVLNRRLNDKTDLSEPSQVHNSQRIHLSNPHSKAIQERERSESQLFPLLSGLPDDVQPSYLNRFFDTTTTIIPAVMMSEPVTTEHTDAGVDLGLGKLVLYKPVGKAYASDEEILQWDNYFEQLKFVMDYRFSGSSDKPSPYFMGFIPVHVAHMYITTQGFFDLAMHGGEILHGTASHMMQLLNLRRAGMPPEALAGMDDECWILAMDQVNRLWFAGFAIDDSERVYAFYNLPNLGVPGHVQMLMTERFFSRLLEAMAEHQYSWELEYFQRQWLKVDHLLSRDQLLEWAKYAMVLENILIAEHNSNWIGLVGVQKTVMVDEPSMVDGMTFNPFMIKHNSQARKARALKRKGYKEHAFIVDYEADGLSDTKNTASVFERSEPVPEAWVEQLKQIEAERGYRVGY